MREDRPLWLTILYSASAATIAEATTLPFDTAKVLLARDHKATNDCENGKFPD